MPIDRVGITDSSGKLVFDNLPAGQYTISEIEAPDGYELSKPSFRSISITWGQTASTAFYNKPKTRLEVIKVDGNTNAKLAGAIFRLTDPTTGEFWEGETAADGRILLGAGNGSRGNQLESETTYILTEIQAPPGYVLDPAPREVVLGANNIPNSLTFANFKKPTLTVIKYDELTNLPLAGASFRLWKTEGETWSETQITGADGKITWTDLDPGIYSIQEIDEPYGYFKDPARKEILLKGGDNKQLEFFNRPRPILTILKRDAITGQPLADVKFKVQKLEVLTIGEFLTDANGRIELSPRTGYLLDEAIYRVTEILPPNEYLLSPNFQKDVLLKWYELTELVFENVLKPTLIFIKRDGMSGRGISGATYKVEYESPTGGVTIIGSYVTKCGLIVIPHVLPGWYSLTETSPASGYQLPTNPTQRLHLAPGENSYTYAQTHEDLYVDPRTNPNSGNRGDCGDCCGYLCSVLCGNNCGHAGDGTMASGDGSNSGGAFGNITITNGNGQVIGGGNTGGGTTPTPTAPTLTAGTVTRLGNYSATITFTSSAAGKYYTAYTASGNAAPTISTLGTGTACAAGANTIPVSLTTGAKDFYIKVKDAAGNISDALKITIPAYNAQTETPTPSDTPPDFSGIKIRGGTVVYLNPDPLFAGIIIKFGNY
jgi:5-hydroxyisourate hydrolase-like protein (transthyretin family)